MVAIVDTPPDMRVQRTRAGVAGIGLVVLSFVSWSIAARPVQSPTAAMPPVVAVGPPAGVGARQVDWIEVSAPGRAKMLAAVAKPAGAGPFPAVIVLHGSHGFAEEYVDLAQALAREGFLAVAPCWFSGGGGAGARFVTSINCPEAPPRVEASSSGAMQRVDALVDAVRTLPRASPDGVGLFGHSRGGGAALNYVMSSRKVRAVVLNSAGYPGSLSDVASRVTAPVLILHGTSDSPEGGGSEFTNVQMARGFELAMRRLGMPIEARYYEGGEHNGIFASRTQFNDEVECMAAFFHRHLSQEAIAAP